MPWCPKCKLEYREGFKRCSDCDIELVKELEQEEDQVQEYDSEELLTTVYDDFMATIIEAKLKDRGIPVLKRYKGPGGFLNIFMGASNLGVDLYVPGKLLEQA